MVTTDWWREEAKHCPQPVTDARTVLLISYWTAASRSPVGQTLVGSDTGGRYYEANTRPLTNINSNICQQLMTKVHGSCSANQLT